MNPRDFIHPDVVKQLPDDVNGLESNPSRLKGLTLRVLISYYYARGEETVNRLRKWLDIVAPGEVLDIIADSGVFTARQFGERIDVHEYARWAQQLQSACSGFFNVDLGSVEEQEHNCQVLFDAGVPAIPIYHVTMGEEKLHEYVERYSYIGIGSGTLRFEINSGYSGGVYHFYDRCFSIARNRCGLHGLAVMGRRALMRYPWASCDSQGWNTGMQYAQIHLFNERAGRLETCYGFRPDILNYLDLFRDYGLDPRQYLDRRRYDIGARVRLIIASLESFMRYERWLRTQHWPRMKKAVKYAPPQWNLPHVGTKLYAVIPSDFLTWTDEPAQSVYRITALLLLEALKNAHGKG